MQNETDICYVTVAKIKLRKHVPRKSTVESLQITIPF